MTMDLCETFADLPEVPRVERLAWKPGDRIVLTFQGRLSDATYAEVAEQIKAWGLPPGTVLVLDQGTTLQVLEGAAS